MSTAICTALAPKSPGKRRPESAFQSLYIASKLHRDVRESADADTGAEVRRAVNSDAQLSELSEPTRRAIKRAASVLSDKGSRTALLKLCRESAFAELDVTTQRETLGLLQREGERAPVLPAVASAMKAPMFSKLAPVGKWAAISAMAKLAGTGAARELLQLLGVRGLVQLKPQEQRVLLGYFRGIVFAKEVAPMRKSRLELVWNNRRRELSRFVRAPSFVRSKPQEQASLLLEFLHGRCEEVFFVDATGVNGHGTVVFGDPSNPRNISYGRRWVVSKSGSPVARIYNPDPTVQSKWQHPQSNAKVRYVFKAIKVSRLVSWRLLNTIEKTFPITDDERARPGMLGQRPPCPAKGTFLSEVESILVSLCARSGKLEVRSGYMQAGRCIQSASKTKNVGESLAQLLSA